MFCAAGKGIERSAVTANHEPDSEGSGMRSDHYDGHLHCVLIRALKVHLAVSFTLV